MGGDEWALDDANNVIGAAATAAASEGEAQGEGRVGEGEAQEEGRVRKGAMQYGGPTPSRRGKGSEMALDDWQDEETPRGSQAGTPSQRSPLISQREGSRAGRHGEGRAEGGGSAGPSPARRRHSNATPPPNPFAPHMNSA